MSCPHDNFKTCFEHSYEDGGKNSIVYMSEIHNPSVFPYRKAAAFRLTSPLAQ